MLFTIFKKIYSFSFIKWLFRYNNTELKLHKTDDKRNYYTTISRQYLLNSSKYLENTLTNKKLGSGTLNSVNYKKKKDGPNNFSRTKQKH